MSQDFFAQIEDQLKKCIPIESVAIEDFSHAHRKHKESIAHGGAHLKIQIYSPELLALKPIERHRAVHSALKDFLDKKLIHALTLEFLTSAPES